jgi:membrane protease YdiL (CAAX protease family)
VFDDPAFPSMPPPGDDATVKPMSLLSAAMWATGAQLAFLWVLNLMVMLRESAGYDLVGRIVCQVVGYGLTFYLLLRFYAPESRIRDLAAIRSSNPWFYPLGLGLGLAATYPSYWVLGLVYERFPPPEQEMRWIDLFYAGSMPEQIAVAVGTIALGPIVEELIFRGALFRPLRQQNSPFVVVIATSLLFAAVHLDVHRLLPLFLMGLTLGYLRWASGSLIPPILLHMGFNAVPFFELFQYSAPPAKDAPDELALPWVLGGLVASAVLLLLSSWLARRSRRASAARRDD